MRVIPVLLVTSATPIISARLVCLACLRLTTLATDWEPAMLVLAVVVNVVAKRPIEARCVFLRSSPPSALSMARRPETIPSPSVGTTLGRKWARFKPPMCRHFVSRNLSLGLRR